MAKFKKGESGNPGGRPRQAKGLRSSLEARYGQDGEKLVDMLDGFLKSKTEKIRLDAWKIGMAYQFGQPTQRLEHEDTTPDVPKSIAFVFRQQANSGNRS